MNTDGHRCAGQRREAAHEGRRLDIATFSGRSPSGAVERLCASVVSLLKMESWHRGVRDGKDPRIGIRGRRWGGLLYLDVDA